MQKVSKAYKEAMKKPMRNRGYIKATIGIINSDAQRNVELNEKTKTTFFSDNSKPFNWYVVDNVYATAEQDFSKVDGSMYFLPKQSSDLSFYNNGIVTNELLGTIYMSFQGVAGLNIKGLTIDWGECYPVDFTIENENVTRYYSGNDKRYWVTEDVFDGTSYLIVKPTKMVNKKGRLRIYQFSCGIVNAFSNKEVSKFTLKEYVSSISDSLPNMDMSLTVDNQNLYYSPDNEESALAYFEIGQEIKVAFGYDVTGKGDIEWLPEQTAYLKTWSANDKEAKFTATDKFDYMSGKYYRGLYRENGISLYDLAADVLNDAGYIDEREYYIDPYLKKIKVRNPIPVVSHAEALQIIANAGRSVLFEGRNRKVTIRSSFVPDMEIGCNGETGFSHIKNVLNDDKKDAYAIASNDFSVADGSVFFLPKNSNYLNTGYISSSIWNEDSEEWSEEPPKINIELEAAFSFYGLLINFRNTAPREFFIRTYNELELVEEKKFQNEELKFVTADEFDPFDRMEIEFIRGHPNARVVIDNIIVGNVTDYILGNAEKTGYATSERQSRIKSISVVKSIYKKASGDPKNISSQDVVVSPESNVHTVYFSKPCYGIEAMLDSEKDDGGNILSSEISVEIIESSSYFAKLRFGGLTEEQSVKYVISGYEFETEETSRKVIYSESGEEILWKNPIVSDNDHAEELEKWLASHYLGDVGYQIKWRGDPRIDANDLFYLESKDRSQSLIRCYQNELSFNGAWSGTMKARKAVL